MAREPRPTFLEYKMTLAVAVASRSNCLKAHVGAILLREERIRAVGYNGTVEGFANCFRGGCPRCRDLTLKQGEQLDRCVCVHAEENALISAARYGIEIAGTECFVTHEPCLSCTKLLIQSRVKQVVYLNSYQYPERQDHNRSRAALRSASRRVKFASFNSLVPKTLRLNMRKRIADWQGELERMKLEAENYGRTKGIFRRGG